MDSLDLEMDNAEFHKNKTKYFMLRWFDEERIFNLLDVFIEEIYVRFIYPIALPTRS